MRVTPEEILTLEEEEVFVFGSNESGIHGSGAARYANKMLDATYFLGFGPSGKCFALPTKDWNIESLPLPVIQNYVDRFVAYTQCGMGRGQTFYVTKIGCGLAGFTPEQIAPMFREAATYENIYLPQEFWDIILKTSDSTAIVADGTEDDVY